MKNQPLVSICLPTYNGSLYLQEALDSVNLQTYSNLELVVSDDDSEDDTLIIVSRFSENSKIPVSIHRHKPNGIGANWNNTVKHSKGDYIKFLFQDDVLAPECISFMVQAVLKNPETVLVYSKRHFLFNERNEKHINWVSKFGILHNYWNNLKVKDGEPINGKHLLANANLYCHPLNKIGEPSATLIKKATMMQVGLFDLHLKQILDIEYWYRIMAYGKVTYIDKELVSIRLHEQQATAINNRNNVDEFYILEKMIGKVSFGQLSFRNKKNFLYRYTVLGKLWKKIKVFLRKLNS